MVRLTDHPDMSKPYTVDVEKRNNNINLQKLSQKKPHNITIVIILPRANGITDSNIQFDSVVHHMLLNVRNNFFLPVNYCLLKHVVRWVGGGGRCGRRSQSITVFTLNIRTD